MKAMVWRGPEEMTVDDVPEPELEAGSVILAVGACGICGSELEGYLGHMDNRVPPLVMGHEFAGTVLEVGDSADEDWRGRTVTVNPIESCGHCALCRAGLDNVCPTRTLIGIHHPGAFAERVRVPVANLRALPEGTSARVGALAEPLANGVHALRLGLSQGPAENAVIMGAGTIGLMCLQAALLSDVPHVAVIELDDARRAHATALGAHAAFGSVEAARDELSGRGDGLGADLVVDAVGAVPTRRGGIEVLRPGGKLVAVGLAADETPLHFHPLVRNQIAVQGSYGYTKRDFDRGLGWLVNGRAGLGELPDPLPLERGPEAFAELALGPGAQVKVFLAEPSPA
jgi:threonine dehydrogenase-like Zn-dependent dehydrogenase